MAVVAWRAPGPLRWVRAGNPGLDAALVGVLVAGVLGFAVNDSGIAVPWVMLGVANTSVVYLVAAARAP